MGLQCMYDIATSDTGTKVLPWSCGKYLSTLHLPDNEKWHVISLGYMKLIRLQQYDFTIMMPMTKTTTFLPRDALSSQCGIANLMLSVRPSVTLSYRGHTD